MSNATLVKQSKMCEVAVGPRLPVDSSARRVQEKPQYIPRVHGVYPRRSRARRKHRSRRSVYRRADKIGRRGRTPTVAPQAYRSRRRWEKNSAVNKMVLTLLVVGGRKAIALHPGLSRATVEDATVRRLLFSVSHLSPPSYPFNMADFPHPLPISSERGSSPPLPSAFPLVDRALSPPLSLSLFSLCLFLLLALFEYSCNLLRPATALCSGIIEYTPHIDRWVLAKRLPY